MSGAVDLRAMRDGGRRAVVDGNACALQSESWWVCLVRRRSVMSDRVLGLRICVAYACVFAVVRLGAEL